MNQLVRVIQVEPLFDYVVRLTFTNDEVKEIDLLPLLRGAVFEPMLRDRNEFLRVYVHPVCKTIAWPNEADIDPDVLYYGLMPAWQEDEMKKIAAAENPSLPGLDLPPEILPRSVTNS